MVQTVSAMQIITASTASAGLAISTPTTMGRTACAIEVSSATEIYALLAIHPAVLVQALVLPNV